MITLLCSHSQFSSLEFTQNPINISLLIFETDETIDLNALRVAMREQARRELAPANAALGAALDEAPWAMRALAAEVARAEADGI